MKEITYKGKTQSLSDWARELQVSRQYMSVYLQKYAEYPPEDILAHIDKNNPFKFPRKARSVSNSGVFVSEDKIKLVYEYICHYVSYHQYAPAIQEIADNTSLKSLNSIGIAIRILIERGLLETDIGTGHSRAYRVSKFKLEEIPAKLAIYEEDMGWLCPDCSTNVFPEEDYCTNCGQPLYWT